MHSSQISSPPPVRVFVSYSHDSPDHAARVLGLADLLRQHGIDARIDQYQSHPPEGWPRWMQRQIEEAAFVLLVCTPTFCRRFEGKETPDRGWGATWEGSLVTTALYENATNNTRFLPVLFDEEPEAAVPLVLRAYTRHRVPSGWEALYRYLTGQPAVVAPPLGAVQPMPPRGG